MNKVNRRVTKRYILEADQFTHFFRSFESILVYKDFFLISLLMNIGREWCTCMQGGGGIDSISSALLDLEKKIT